MKALTSIKRVVDFLLNWTMVIMFFCVFLVVLMQIFYRYILRSPLEWSEELSRYVFIWVSLLGWVLATRSGAHIRITFLHERLRPAHQAAATVFFHICTLGFLGTLAWLGWTWAVSPRVFGRGAVTMPAIPMGIIYIALPVSAVLCMFYVVYDIAKSVKAGNEPAATE